MSRANPVFARKPFDRLRAIETAHDAWKERPNRETRDWARLVARAAALDGTDFVRNAAIEALADVGTVAYRRAFVLALDDESELVRTEAVQALARIVGARAEGEILRATRDKSTLVRRYAWLALAEAVGAKSEERLVGAAEKESDPEVAVGIWAGLFEIGRPEARDRLECFAASDDVRVNSWARDSLRVGS